MTLKTFPSNTKHGLGISKTGRLMIPYMAKSDYVNKGLNLYGQPLAEIGDYACACSHNGLITKNNIGKVISKENIADFGESTNIQLEDGTFMKESMWTYGVYVMSKDEYDDAYKYITIKG